MSVKEWVGSTSPSWPLARIKHVCRTAGGGTPDKGKPQYWQGDIPWVSPKDMKSDRITDTEDHITSEGLSNSATQMVPSNSVLVVVRSGILRHSIPVAINEVPVSLNQDMRALLPDERLASRFLARLIEGYQAELLQAWSKVGATVESLESDLIGDTWIPLPPRHEQEAILAFIDRETARADALVAAKIRIIDLLAEKRKAIIFTAVARGLDRNVKMRDSDVPWLGEIPAHWSMTRLKFVARVQAGLALGKDYGVKASTEFPYLRVANVQDGFIDLTDVKTMVVPEREASSAMLRRGDVLMNEGGDADKLGRGAIWNGSIDPCLHQNHVFALRPTLVTSEWLSTWTGADFAKAFFETRAKQSTNLASISSTNLLELPIAVPPDPEQLAIVEHVAREAAKLDAVRAATELTIALLKERRSALIAAAMTGQLALSTAA